MKKELLELFRAFARDVQKHNESPSRDPFEDDTEIDLINFIKWLEFNDK